MPGLLRVLSVLSLGIAAWACGNGHHSHVHRRAVPSVPLTPPSRPLEWGDLNIIHTTDTHGWLNGHQKASFPEPNYSGDLGDFASFVKHMKDIALEKDVDLLLVDSGDLHDGTGISDGFPTPGIDGHESNQFLKQIPYDVMAIGNHELYVYNVTQDMHDDFAPSLNGRYLSSNVNITVVDPSTGTNASVPVGERFAKFTTLKGKKVTALGVLFNFAGNDPKTTVIKVEDMVKEEWFAEAIEEEPDFFLLAGHMPVNGNNWPLVHDAIRAVHADTPILILGGHSHIRDCVQLDERSMSLASGRYFETVGWMSVTFGYGLTFSRRYLDANLVTYQYHTNKTEEEFATPEGQAITQDIKDLITRWDLDHVYGTAPQDYFITAAPYPSNNSELSLFIEQAVPIALNVNNSRADIPALYIAQSGSQRFDVYAGPFTKNDQFTSAPFANGFAYIPEVSYAVAKELTPQLNSDGFQKRKRSLEKSQRLYDLGYVDEEFRNWLKDMNLRRSPLLARDAVNVSVGYVTNDSCPGIGDDTVHTAIQTYDVPDYIVSNPPANITDTDAVDLVFVDFFQDDIIDTLNALQTEKTYSSGDVQKYSDLFTNQIYGVFAEQAWN